MANNKNLISNLYTYVEEPLFLGDRLGKSEFGTLMQPGQFIATDLVEGDATEDMANQAALFNDAYSASFLATRTGRTISETYGNMLEFAALPLSEATPAEQQEIIEIRAWQRNKEAHYIAYRDRYFDAMDALEAERQSHEPSGSRLLNLTRKSKDAYNTWVYRGYKKDWENRQARLEQILSGSPTTYWNELRHRYEAQKRISPAGREFYKTLLYPAVSNWDGASWSRFERTVDDRVLTQTSRSTSWGGGGGFGFGLWSFGGGMSGSSNFNRETTETSDIDVSFEYLRVRINRNWLVPDVFGHRFWDWKKTHGRRVISDGGTLSATPPRRPVGDMPFLTTHAIIVRNVSLRAVFSETERRRASSQFRTQTSVGWGPFKVSGYYSRSSSSEYYHGRVEKAGIFVDKPQVLGFTGTLLPRSPDPIESLPWGEDRVDLGMIHADSERIMTAERALDTKNVMASLADLEQDH